MQNSWQDLFKSTQMKEEMQNRTACSEQCKGPEKEQLANFAKGLWSMEEQMKRVL